MSWLVLAQRWLPFIGIADPDNIVFAKIASHLHLDDDDRRIRVIAKRVMCAKRNID